MYPSIKKLMEKTSRNEKKHQTFQLQFNVITELDYQSEILGITKSKLINHYLELAIKKTQKDKDFIELEQAQQIKNEKSFEKYQSLEDPKIQNKKNAKQK